MGDLITIPSQSASGPPWSVSIIIPTFNHLSDLLKPCIESIVKYTDLSNVEVVVVANGCTDGTGNYVASLGPPFRCIEHVRAVGFTVAANAGISIAKGEYILLLNNDTVLLPQPKNQWLGLLLAPFRRDPNTGVTGPAKFSWDCGGIERRAIAFWCAMIPRRLFMQRGLLDEVFSPGTGEDGDFCIKAETVGYKLVGVPDDVALPFGKGVSNKTYPIYHKGSGTFGDKDYSSVIARNKKILEERYGSKKAAAPVAARVDNLESIYAQCKAHPCDVNEIFPVLRGYAEKCAHVTEFGVRGVMTTWAFLAARPKRMISYDIEYDGNIEGAKKEAALAGIPFEFRLEDVLKADIEPTDLLFIDTQHTYAQLKAELARHAEKVAKYIAIHDTFTFGVIGSDGGLGETVAISEFVVAHPEWCVKEVITHSNGLTVLERIGKVPVLHHGSLLGAAATVHANVESHPLISIVIPTCGKDWEKVLKPCIEAVLQYTDLRNKEIIVVANGASQAAIEWLKALPTWSGSSGRVGARPCGRVITNLERIGYIRAVNAGINECSGEFVVTFDDDCFLMPQEKDDWINRLNGPFSDPAVAAAGPFSTVYPDLGHVLHSGCTMYRKSALTAIGCFDEAFNPGYMSDEDVAIRLRKAGHKLAAVPEGGPKAYVNGMFVLDFPVFHAGTVATMPKHTTDLPLVKKNRDLLLERHKDISQGVIVVIESTGPCPSGPRGETGEPGVPKISIVALNPDLQDLTNLKDYELIPVRENKAGFVSAINDAIRAARGEYVVLLGRDANDEDIRDLLAPFEGSHLTGISGVKYKFNCGGVVRTAIHVRCAMIERALFEALGFLDQAFGSSAKLAMRDFSIKAELAGYALIGVPKDVFSDSLDQPLTMDDALLVKRYGRRGDRLEEIFNIHKNHPSDVNALLPALRAYAEKCQHVTEFGVRDVFTTWAFLVARPKRLVSYDIVYSENVHEAVVEAMHAGLDYSHKLEDVLKADIESTELLFVDTLHTYSQLKSELERHAGKVSKYIAIHDVESFGSIGEDGGPGEMQAIREFLAAHPEWREKEHLTISNGLMVLERVTPIGSLSSLTALGFSTYGTPKISIIIPTYKNNFLKDDKGNFQLDERGEKVNILKENLKSLAKYTDLVERGIEVIVVCNGCVDGQEEYVKSLGAPYRVISFHDAIGYTRATNEGIKVALGEHLIFINDDVVMLPQPKNQWLDFLLEPFKDPKMGITGPLQLHDDYADEDVIIGFCLCVSRKVLNEVMPGGILDEIYTPGGGEDIDLCVHARRAGYIVKQVPKEGKLGFSNTNNSDFMIWHINNQTFKDIPEYTNWIIKRNGFINAKKHNRNLRLNLGAGGIEYKGFLSVDLYDKRASIIMDATKLDLPDNSVAEIIAIHLLEHLVPYHVDDVLREWLRVLKPGGRLLMEMPDVEDLCRRFTATKDFNERWGILNALYAPVNTTGEGEPTDITSPHLYGYWPEELGQRLQRTGFVGVAFGPECFPHPYPPNLHVEAWKPQAAMPVDVVTEAEKIDGWMSTAELRWLSEQAKTHKVIVEVGSWKGRSTKALTATPGVVYAVDHWLGSQNEQGTFHVEAARGEDIFGVFKANFSREIEVGKVVVERLEATDAARWLKEHDIRPDMIFIDGEHSTEAVKRDIGLFRPLLAPGGLLCGHDYLVPNWASVVAAVDEVVPGRKIIEGTTIWVAPKSMAGLWSFPDEQFPYGDETTYAKAAEFLHGCAVIEDWGCATAYFKRFINGAKYIGVDGSASKFCDIVGDLGLYRSQADGILLRHVVEHNYDWKRILQNAVASFTKRLVVVIFTPFGSETKQIATNWSDIPDLSFCKEELVECFEGLPYTEESFKTATQYGVEHVFCISKVGK